MTKLDGEKVTGLAKAMSVSPVPFAAAFLSMLEELQSSQGSSAASNAQMLMGLLMGLDSGQVPAPTPTPSPNLPTFRTRCGKCGNQGHNARTCGKSPPPPKGKQSQKKSLGEKRAYVEAKYPGFFESAGKCPDVELANKFRVSRGYIGILRKKFQIPVFLENKRPGFTSEQEALLGTKPDSELAAMWGISPHLVKKQRLKLGIKAWNQCRELDARIEEHRDKIGKISDIKVGKLLGVGSGVIYRYRQRHGIKTEVIAPTHEDFVPLDRVKLTKLFYKGASDEEIAEELGTTPGTVANIRTHELELFRRGPAPKPSTEGERERAVRIFNQCGSFAETARRMGRSPSWVKRVTT